mmetsp:Transcript_17653/g.32640  ORF Transcript_17653/g.32640 Transcript_17653/m.32640 type:complete len:135 (-) Transcript_17653:41-445(-)
MTLTMKLLDKLSGMMCREMAWTKTLTMAIHLSVLPTTILTFLLKRTRKWTRSWSPLNLVTNTVICVTVCKKNMLYDEWSRLLMIHLLPVEKEANFDLSVRFCLSNPRGCSDYDGDKVSFVSRKRHLPFVARIEN